MKIRRLPKHYRGRRENYYIEKKVVVVRRNAWIEGDVIIVVERHSEEETGGAPG
jgi:hypothetical protein